MLRLRRAKREERELTRDICAAVMERAREPVFYLALGVPDTFDGRFDLAVLHAWLVLERLRSAGHSRIAQGLVDELFTGFDDALRQLGASDMTMGRKLKKIADAFYGRLAAYGDAHDLDALSAAILRNVYRGDEGRAAEAAGLATYALGCRFRLGDWSPEDGPPVFDHLPKFVSA